MKKSIIAVAFVVLGGCAIPDQYAIKEGTTAEERVQDSNYCQSQLVQPEPLRSGYWPKRGSFERAQIERELRKDYIKCMTSKGYSIITG